MRLLTEENITFDINKIPDEIPEALCNIQYCVLDYSNKQDVDYYFIPLVFLESFVAPAIELKIGNHILQMPLDWSIVVGDRHLGDLEVLQLDQLNDRSFSAFSINPISSFVVSYYKIEIINIFMDKKWYFPKLKYGHLLAVPLSTAPKSECVFFVKETSKIPDILDIEKVS